MLAFLLSPLYILLNVYICRWLLLWMSACHSFFHCALCRAAVILIYIFIAATLLTDFFLPQSQIKRFFKLLGNYWLGTLLYIILAILFADLLRILLSHIHKINPEILHSHRLFVINGGLCIAVIVSLSLYGIYNARHIRTTHYEVTVEKDGGHLDSLNIALIADLHIGYNIGTEHIKHTVEKVNALDPDIILIAGDIFDNAYEALDDPEALIQILRKLKSKYGVYACYGNHDVSEKILAGFTFHSDKKKVSDPRMDAFLEKADITLIRDDTVLIENSFYLAVRPDYARPGRGITTRRTPREITLGLDMTKPVIVMEHEPKELDTLEDAGVDLHLAGHTHDGQMWPGTWITDLIWENSYGYLKKGSMQSIVTSGVGVFGSFMRVGSKSEVCQINVIFQP